MMKITVVGGGNVGTLVAGEFTKKGNEVTIYTRDKSKWSDKITVLDRDTDSEYTYTPYKITEDIKEAVSEAEIVFVTMPAMAIKKFILSCHEYIRPNTWVGFYPGTGGIEFICSELIKKGCVIFGTQRISSVIRLKKYGEYVITSGKRKELFLGTIPQNMVNVVSDKMSELLDIKINALPNYLNVTLIPSNPILHPSRLYSIFKDYEKDKVYENVPMFYENWNDDSSKCLISCDEELHKILDVIKMDTSYIRPLLEHYESTDYKSLTKKICSINSFKGITTPSLKVDGGYIPDFNDRYFTADFPYGLIIIKAFGLICNIMTPNIDKIILWYQNIVGKEYINFSLNTLGKDSYELSLPQLYGINTVLEIEKYYTER